MPSTFRDDGTSDLSNCTWIDADGCLGQDCMDYAAPACFSCPFEICNSSCRSHSFDVVSLNAFSEAEAAWDTLDGWSGAKY